MNLVGRLLRRQGLETSFESMSSSLTPAHRELIGIYYAVLSLPKEFRHSNVVIYNDNTNARDALRTLNVKSKALYQLASVVRATAASYGLNLIVEHLAGEQMTRVGADHASRIYVHSPAQVEQVPVTLTDKEGAQKAHEAALKQETKAGGRGQLKKVGTLWREIEIPRMELRRKVLEFNDGMSIHPQFWADISETEPSWLV